MLDLGQARFCVYVDHPVRQARRRTTTRKSAIEASPRRTLRRRGQLCAPPTCLALVATGRATSRPRRVSP
eukprot:scaffold1146_cov399-Prasinococcus_capsulatus_cf.AAC.84